MKTVINILWFLLLTNILNAQQKDSVKVNSLKDFFLKGKTKGEVRNYFMNTNNYKELYDYYANGSGGNLCFETARWKGFKFKVKGIFAFNTFSSDLNAVDPIVHKSSKWEKELFDLNNPLNKHNFDRLETFYLDFKKKSFHFKLGKYEIKNTPLINESDARMKPFMFKGAHLDIGKKNKLIVNFITAVSPRGMTEWYPIHEAIGLLNNGKSINGNEASYLHQTPIRYIANFGLKKKINKQFNLENWYYRIDKSLHLNWLEFTYEKNDIFVGTQFIYERALAYQKELDEKNQLYSPQESGIVGAFRIQKKYKKGFFNLNYSKISNKGRFIFPKEFGRDRLYSSIPFSFAEGLGNSQIYSIRTQREITISKNASPLVVQLNINGIFLKESENLFLNKYSIRDHFTKNFSISYEFKDKLEGLQLQFIYHRKFLINKKNIPMEELFNRYQFHQFHLITHIIF